MWRRKVQDRSEWIIIMRQDFALRTWIPEENSVKKLTLLRPERNRRAGRPKLRWLDKISREGPQDPWHWRLEKKSTR